MLGKFWLHLPLFFPSTFNCTESEFFQRYNYFFTTFDLSFLLFTQFRVVELSKGGSFLLWNLCFLNHKFNALYLIHLGFLICLFKVFLWLSFNLVVILGDSKDLGISYHGHKVIFFWFSFTLHWRLATALHTLRICIFRFFILKLAKLTPHWL